MAVRRRCSRPGWSRRLSTPPPTSARVRLRLEYFGGLYYRSADASFFTISPEFTELLMFAMQGRLLEAYVRRPERYRVSEDRFSEEVASWQTEGIVDDDFRCHATLVGPQPGASGHLMGPMVTNIQLTQACNLRCKHCFVDIDAKPHPDELTTKQLFGLFGELRDLGSPIVILAGGEPMIRRDFWQIAENVADFGLDAALCTNATLINHKNASRLAASGIRWYSISLDGPDAATHDYLRGQGRFERACRGIRALLAAGAKDVKIRVTVAAHNADRLAGFASVAAELGVEKVVMKPFRHTAGSFGSTPTELYITRREYFQAAERALTDWPKSGPALELDDGMPQGLPDWTQVIPEYGCVGGTTHASVIYDGRVVACDAIHDPNDWTLHDHSFAECWRQAPTLTAWRSLSDNDQCGSCSSRRVCKGGCRARAVGMGGTLHDPDPWAKCETEQRLLTKRPAGLAILA